jgi:hypothetical protein
VVNHARQKGTHLGSRSMRERSTTRRAHNTRVRTYVAYVGGKWRPVAEFGDEADKGRGMALRRLFLPFPAARVEARGWVDVECDRRRGRLRVPLVSRWDDKKDCKTGAHHTPPRTIAHAPPHTGMPTTYRYRLESARTVICGAESV